MYFHLILTNVFSLLWILRKRMPDPVSHAHCWRTSVSLYVHENFVIWGSTKDYGIPKCGNIASEYQKRILIISNSLENEMWYRAAVVNTVPMRSSVTYLIKPVIKGIIILSIGIDNLMKDWMSYLFLPSEFLELSSSPIMQGSKNQDRIHRWT